jgi:DnaK suppressor protein
MKENIKKIITELTGERKALIESSKPVAPENSLGRLTRMDAIAGAKMNEAALERIDLRIKMLHAALKRLEDGEYGICLSCGDDISPKRLNALPEATICIECI